MSTIYQPRSAICPKCTAPLVACTLGCRPGPHCECPNCCTTFDSFRSPPTPREEITPSRSVDDPEQYERRGHRLPPVDLERLILCAECGHPWSKHSTHVSSERVTRPCAFPGCSCHVVVDDKPLTPMLLNNPAPRRFWRTSAFWRGMAAGMLLANLMICAVWAFYALR